MMLLPCPVMLKEVENSDFLLQKLRILNIFNQANCPYTLTNPIKSLIYHVGFIKMRLAVHMSFFYVMVLSI